MAESEILSPPWRRVLAGSLLLTPVFRPIATQAPIFTGAPPLPGTLSNPSHCYTRVEVTPAAELCAAHFTRAGTT